jgi:hypothetical protein
MHHVFDILDVYASSCHISSHKYDVVARQKAVYGFQSCPLLHV